MNVDTGAFADLAAQVAALAERVEQGYSAEAILARASYGARVVVGHGFPAAPRARHTSCRWYTASRPAGTARAGTGTACTSSAGVMPRQP